MTVHIKPKTIDGRPSAMSVALMFTSLIYVKTQYAILKIFKIRPYNSRWQLIPVYLLMLF